MSHLVSAASELLLAVWKEMDMGHVPIKFCFWTLKFELQIIFMHHKNFFFFLFCSYLRSVKTIHSLGHIKKGVVGLAWSKVCLAVVNPCHTLKGMIYNE